MQRVVLTMVLIFIVAFAGVKVWYNHLEEIMIAPPSNVEERAVVSQGVNEVARSRVEIDYSIIVDRNIFGAVLEKTTDAIEIPEVEEPQPTSLDLSLMGTISGNQNGSRAIISDKKTRKQNIYSVGDEIQGALIKSIERRRVVLQVNGKDEVLDIKDREGGSVTESSVPATTQQTLRKSLRERLTVRRPSVRPTRSNRPRPVVRNSVSDDAADEDNDEFDEEVEDGDEDIDDEDLEDEGPYGDG